MAQKKITDLQLIDAVESDLNLAGDDGIQSYRLTAAQLKDFILPNAGLTREKLAVGAIAKNAVFVKNANYTVDSSIDDMIICDCSSNSITLTLPAANTNTGKILTIKKKDANTSWFKVIVDPNGAELIDAISTDLLVMPNESRTYICDGVGWRIANAYYGDSVTRSFTSSQVNAPISGILKRSGKYAIFMPLSVITGVLSGSVEFTLPSDLTIDHNFTTLPAATGGGMLSLVDTSTADRYQAVGTWISSTSIRVRPTVVASTYIRDTNITATVPFTWANGDVISGDIFWPVVGW